MKYALFIGRYQPLHEGHKKLIQTVLDEGSNVCVALRDTPRSESDPYSIREREDMFNEAWPQETKEGQLKIISIPDIESVCYGRKVGYAIREIELDERTQAISATEIRRNMVNGTERSGENDVVGSSKYPWRN